MRVTRVEVESETRDDIANERGDDSPLTATSSASMIIFTESEREDIINTHTIISFTFTQELAKYGRYTLAERMGLLELRPVFYLLHLLNINAFTSQHHRRWQNSSPSYTRLGAHDVVLLHTCASLTYIRTYIPGRERCFFLFCRRGACGRDSWCSRATTLCDSGP